MDQVTSRRIAKAEPLLERFRAELHRTGSFNCHQFETEVGACWKVGFQAMKSRVIDLAKHPRYAFLATHYMENSNGSRQFVAAEFKAALAKQYGIRGYGSPDMPAARDKFWKKIQRKD